MTNGEELSSQSVAKMTNSSIPKPISTSSPAGLAAAQMVTPGKLSSLLLEKGPLAIRHITQTLGNEIPSFKDLSSSKQRRLIMSAMESGDREHCVVFEKIGWGQWSAKIVKSEEFLQEREATNAANAKVKDIVSQESQRRRSSSNNNGRRPQLSNKPSSNNSIPKQPQQQTPGGKSAEAAVTTTTADRNFVYIDENAVASEDDEEPVVGIHEGDEEDDDDEDDEDDEFYTQRIKNEDLYSVRRRKSSVVFGDSSPEDIEHELLAQRVRPLLKNRSRRSSSKIRTASISKPTVHLDLPNSAVITSVSGSNTSNMPSSSLTRNNSVTKIDLEQLTNSISEPTSRRESRVSFSKESSIRSTLLPHKNYHWIPTSSPRLTYQVSSQVPPLLSSASSTSNQGKKKFTHRNKNKNRSELGGVYHPHSDTDEEDWASIGAASLRNNSVPPKMDTVSTSPNGFVAPKVPDTAHIPNLDDRLPPPAIHQDRERRANPSDDNNAAFLLMSLKS